MTIILEFVQLEAIAHERPPGYVQEVLSTGLVDKEQGTVELERTQYDELRLKYSGKAGGCCGQ